MQGHPLNNKNEKNNMTHHSQKNNCRSFRLNGYDYSQAGLCFISIVTQNRICLFGKIESGVMVLNDAGRMVKNGMAN